LFIACLFGLAAAITSDVGVPFLLIWPTARSTALAGAMTALADDPDAGFWNPAGLASQSKPGLCATYASWLPGLYPGMHYAHVAGGAPLSVSILGKRRLYVGGSATYIDEGETEVINERGEYLGRRRVWRLAAGPQAGIEVADRLAAGVGFRIAHAENRPFLLWRY